MRSVNQNRRQLLLPAAFAAGSFLVLFLIMSTTSPARDITYAAAVFLALTVFLVSLGYLAVRLGGRPTHPKTRYRIFIISIFLVTLLMFRSAQSLGPVDGLVLLVITIGLLFYIGRRSY